jgi:hypothetical protein
MRIATSIVSLLGLTLLISACATMPPERAAHRALLEQAGTECQRSFPVALRVEVDSFDRLVAWYKENVGQREIEPFWQCVRDRIRQKQLAIAPIPKAPAMPGERWTGVSTGEGSGCHPLTLTLTINEREISGYATMQTAAVTLYWEATGQVLPGNAVVVTTKTGDSGIAGNVIRWEGTLTEAGLTLRQPSSLNCREPRSAVLTRSR